MSPYSSSAYFLERETDLYHIVAVGEDRESAFVTLQSKATGLAVYHFSAAHSDPAAENEGLAWWTEYLEKAESLDGDALDHHLRNFVPLTRLNTLSVSGINNYSSPTNPETGHAIVSLATMLDAGVLEKKSTLLDITRQAIASVERYHERHRNTDKDDYIQSLLSDMQDMQHHLLNDNESEALMSGRYQRYLDRMRGHLYPSGILQDAALTSEEAAPFYRLISALHESRLNKHQDGRRHIELSSGFDLPDLDSDHPYHEAIKRMVMGNDPLVPNDLLNATGWFGGQEGASRKSIAYPHLGSPNASITQSISSDGFYGLQKAGGVRAMHLLTRCQSQEEKRNLFQAFQAFDFDIGGLLSSATNRGITMLKSGKPMNEYIWEYVKGLALSNGVDESVGRKKFGKKETQLMIHNMQALNHILYHAKEGEIKTSHGDTLRVSPYSREDIIGSKYHRLDIIDPGISNAAQRREEKNSGKYARIRYLNNQGEEVFHGDMEISGNHISSPFAMESPGFAMTMLDLPPDTITRPEHFAAILAVATNADLRDDLLKGGIMLRDKQIKRSDLYTGPWKSLVNLINHQVAGSPDIAGSSYLLFDKLRKTKALEKYIRTSHLDDMEDILNSAVNAVKAHYLVNAESPHGNMDALLDNDEGLDNHVLMVHGEQFPLNTADALSLHKDLYYNAKLELSDRAHKNFSALKKVAGPDAPVSWGPALPPITLEVPGQSPIVITNLSSYSRINEEGSTMSHCLASYAGRCLRGEYAAFSITQDGKPVATLGMEADMEEAEFDQLQGHGNGAVDPVIHDVVMERFVRPLEENGEVEGHEFEMDTSSARDTRLNRQQLLSMQLDFEVFNDDKMQACREYLLDLVPADKVVAMVEHELDRQVALYVRHELDYDIDGFFDAEQEQIRDSREKLYQDFGLSMECQQEMAAR